MENDEHLTEEEIARYVHHQLSPDEEKAVKDHLVKCSECLYEALLGRALADMEAEQLLPEMSHGRAEALRNLLHEMSHDRAEALPGKWVAALILVHGAILRAQRGFREVRYLARTRTKFAAIEPREWAREDKSPIIQKPSWLDLDEMPGKPSVSWQNGYLVLRFRDDLPSRVRLSWNGNEVEKKIPRSGVLRVRLEPTTCEKGEKETAGEVLAYEAEGYADDILFASQACSEAFWRGELPEEVPYDYFRDTSAESITEILLEIIP